MSAAKHDPEGDDMSTTMATPTRSRQQRLEALNFANQVRSYRASIKRRVAAGEVSLGDALSDQQFATAKVYDVLLAHRAIGPVKAARVMSNCRISLAKTCGGLTERQRRELLDVSLSRPVPAAVQDFEEIALVAVRELAELGRPATTREIPVLASSGGGSRVRALERRGYVRWVEPVFKSHASLWEVTDAGRALATSTNHS